MSPRPSIAHYRITSKLGEGGMGEVWRATDTKLGREVAIKVLPESFAADADRMARFQREAQVLASLNHPNIAAIYGVEERALVMELVEGETLADRIAKGAIPVDEALPLARQIAEALEYAHERGIVHRDLKPANIKVTPEGRVKVLDFGLAKALSNDAAAADAMSSPTITMRATMAGVIMGTAGYMSPEQAKGKPVDRRADIWAFGVVLVEMLTGRAMYTGETVTETLASVIKDAPEIPRDVPAHVRSLLRRCLEKDPQRRLQAIGEARILLDPGPVEEAAPVVTPPVVRRGAPWWIVAVAALIPAAMLGGWLWRVTRPVDKPLMRFVDDLGPEAVRRSRHSITISPDGKRIAYAVRTGSGDVLATSLLSESKAAVLPGTENIVTAFFSPDGQWVGFFAAGKMWKVAVQGGAAVPLCEATSSRGGYWAADGYIYANVDGVQVVRVSEGGGTPQTVVPPAAGVSRREPQVLPGGEAILVTSAGVNNSRNIDESEAGVYSIKTGKYKALLPGAHSGRYVRTGHLLFERLGTLFAVKFDVQRLETIGNASPLVDGVASNPVYSSVDFEVAENGTLVYLPVTTESANSRVAWMDKSGAQQQILAAPSARTLTPRVSPDGKLLAMSLDKNLVVYDSVRGSMTHLTFPPMSAYYPVWMPDGKHIIFSGGGQGIWSVRSDGSAKPEQLYEVSNTIAQAVSPDGKVLAFHQSGQSRDLYTLALDLSDPDHPKAGKATPFLLSRGADVDPAFSPDGRWLAYATSESGKYQVFVRPFPEGASGAGQAQISSVPGRFPLWSPTKKEIYYVSVGEGDSQIMAAPYAVNGRAFSSGKPEVWCEKPVALTGVNIPLDIAPDGKRFVVFPNSEMGGAQRERLHAIFLVNFFDELKRRLP